MSQSWNEPRKNLTVENLATHTENTEDDKQILVLEQQLKSLDELYDIVEKDIAEIKEKVDRTFEDIKNELTNEYSPIEEELKKQKKERGAKKYANDNSEKPSAMIRKGPNWSNPLRTISDPVTPEEIQSFYDKTHIKLPGPVTNTTKEGGNRRKRRTKRRTKRKTKRRTKRRTKRKTKRRTRKKRGRGLGFSRPAKVAAVGALVLGSGAAAVSPAAKQTYQEIMRAPCDAPFRQMILPHHPDKGGTVEGFSFVESARQFKKKSCGNTRPTETPKEKPPGKSGKRWRREQNEQRRQAREKARKQSEQQEKADRRAGQNETPEDTTSYGDIAAKIGATAVVGATALGAAHQLLAPNRGRRRENLKEVDGQRFVRVNPDSGRGQLHRDGHRWRALTPPRR